MQSEEYPPYHPTSYGRRRLGRNRGRALTVAVLVAGLVIGVLAGRWSVSDVEEFVEEDPPIAPKDPRLTALDEFEGINLVSPVLSPDLYTSRIPPDQKAIVTSLYTDSYGVAVSTLGFSLSKTSTTARKIVIYLPEKVSNYTLCRVRAAGWELLPVEYVPPPEGGKDVFWRFLDQYTKLRIWTLDREPGTQLRSVVYLDADTLVKRNFDELFDLPFVFGAATDVYLDNRGFSIGFNAGVLAIKPDSKVFEDMLTKIYRNNYKHGDAEQGFLNLYYGQQVVRIPHIYNGNLAIKTKSPTYWDAIRDEMRIVHFTLTKPFDMAPRCGDEGGMCTVEEIWDTSRHKGFVEMAKADRNGDFREEVEWWESVYDEMMESVETDHCTFTER